MNKIASFTVNHDLLEKGMYISRIDGDIVTYDIRMKKPNGGDYLENAALHAFEHLFATLARNSEFSQDVIYVGPMGCRTGFYLLFRNNINNKQAIELVKTIFKEIAEYEGAIPGASRRECGNYRELSLDGAKQIALDMNVVLKDWTEKDLQYKA